MALGRLTLCILLAFPAARAQAEGGAPQAAGAEVDVTAQARGADTDADADADAAATDDESALRTDWSRLSARADAPLEELSRLMGSATSTLETYHRHFESRLGEMSAERILSAVRGATLANAVALLLYAPLTAFVSLVSGRLGRFVHATYAGVTGWSLLVAEMPLRVRGRRGAVRFLGTQVGRASALAFAAAASWRSGPVGMLLSALTALNALYGAYVTAVHPAFRPELEQLANVWRGLAAVARQLWRAVLRALNSATGGAGGAGPQSGPEAQPNGYTRSRARPRR